MTHYEDVVEMEEKKKKTDEKLDGNTNQKNEKREDEDGRDLVEDDDEGLSTTTPSGSFLRRRRPLRSKRSLLSKGGEGRNPTATKHSRTTPTTTPLAAIDGSTEPTHEPTHDGQEEELAGYKKTSKLLETTMIRFTFNEPLIHPIVSSFVQRHEQLTHLSEDGLPGWASFLALYGLFYRKWMRSAMDVGLWVASISLMLIAMYDLFQNVSFVRHLVGWLFGSWFEWFENAVMMRLMLVLPQLTMITSIWRLFQNVFSGLKNLCMTCGACLSPCIQCGRLLIVTVTQVGRYVCCCCRGSQAAVEAAAKAAPSGSGIMRCYKMVQWVVTTFHRLVLGGIGRIGVWIMNHWTSMYRDIVAKRLRSGLFAGFVVVVLIYFLG
jgi:hypothetical protein